MTGWTSRKEGDVIIFNDGTRDRAEMFRNRHGKWLVWRLTLRAGKLEPNGVDTFRTRRAAEIFVTENPAVWGV